MWSAPKPTLFVNGRLAWRNEAAQRTMRDLFVEVESQREDIALVQDDSLVALLLQAPEPEIYQYPFDAAVLDSPVRTEEVEGFQLMRRPWDLLADVPLQLERDWARVRDNVRPSAGTVHETAIFVNAGDIVIGSGTVIKAGAIVSAEKGPVILGANVTIDEGAIVRGPCFLGHDTRVKAGTRIHASAAGPHSRLGGEIANSIIQSHSNKAHDGYLGDSFLGSWCNLGADTNTSNMRNDYGFSTMFNEHLGVYEETGRQFLGVVMGDHSKCGINTMFNTATVVGVGCNLFGAGYLPRHVPSFTWGGYDREGVNRIEKMIETARAVMVRRGEDLSDEEAELLSTLFVSTHQAA
jgi:UDP-N-acetylglucosamine diphosphorylase/glucosamine-1-phosphate N-acetyltransferase